MESISILSQEQYAHIKEKSFNPHICPECREIDAVFVNLIANARLISSSPDLYEALEAITIHFRKLDKLYSKDLEMLEAGDEALAKAKS